MSHKSFVIADPHFGHKNILNFVSNGKKVRDFTSVEEMDQLIIQNWNRVVRPVDRVYVLGDVCMNRRCIKTIEKVNGRKILIKGNHDLFQLKDYLPYFEDIRAYRVFPKHGVILSHIPIHPSQLERWKLNVHGHTHNNIIPDKKYLNVCVEQTNYTPIDLDEIFNTLKINNER